MILISYLYKKVAAVKLLNLVVLAATKKKFSL